MFALSIDSNVNQQVWEFLLSGGTFMFFIVACSVVSVAIVIHRALSLRREGVMPRSLVMMLESAEPGKVEVATIRRQSSDGESPLGDIVAAALGEESDTSIEDASRAAEAVAREEVLRMQTGLAVLEDVITIAPLLGLLGTVSGLVGVFAELGDAGADSADPAVLAGGIARALNTTIGGLAVAVPTVIARSYFTKKIETMAARMEVLVGRLIHAVHRGAASEPQQKPPVVMPTPAFEPEPQVVETTPAVVTVPDTAPMPTSAPATMPAIPQPSPSPVPSPPPSPQAPESSTAAPPMRTIASQMPVQPQPIPRTPPASSSTIVEAERGEGEGEGGSGA